MNTFQLELLKDMVYDLTLKSHYHYQLNCMNGCLY